MWVFELQPTNGRKTFYRKAMIKETDNFIILESYGTEVAGYNKEDETFSITENKEWLTRTTMTHIKAFEEYLQLNQKKVACT